MKRLPLAYACRQDFARMPRIGRDRFCGACETRVHSLSDRTEMEASALLLLLGGTGLCISFRYDDNGDIRFRPPRTAGANGGVASGLAAPALAALAVHMAAMAGCSASAAPSRSTVVAPTAISALPPAPLSSEDENRAAVAAVDADHDEIPESMDLCPDQAEDMDHFEDEDGCPERDNDHDRVADASDACPNEPETYNGLDDEDGCPDAGGVGLYDTPVRVLQQLRFSRNSAIIQRSDAALLDALERTLQGNPDLRRVLVEGHASTDEGNPAARNRLSLARAVAVRDALVARGVDGARLEPVGRGSDQPFTPGAATSQRAADRRVGFTVPETCAAPAAPAPAAPATPAPAAPARSTAPSR